MSIRFLSSLQLIYIAIELEPKPDISYNFRIHPIRMKTYIDIEPNILLIISYSNIQKTILWTYRDFTIGKGYIFAFRVDLAIAIIREIRASETFFNLALFRFINACSITASPIRRAQIFSVRDALSWSWWFANAAVFWAIRPITPWAKCECAQSRFADWIRFTQEIQCASHVPPFQIWIYNFI